MWGREKVYCYIKVMTIITPVVARDRQADVQ